jgi:hypothetical protein
MYFLFLVSLFLLLSSCGNRHSNTEEACIEKVYVNAEFGNLAFLIDGKLQAVHKWEEYSFHTFPTDDSIFSAYTNRIYYKQTLYSCGSKYDTIEMANCIDLPRVLRVFLYNLRIIDTKWEVARYHPCTYVKGTYAFNITASEDRIFKGILNKFPKNAKQNYYPIRDTISKSSILPSAIYLKMQLDRKQTEYFGSSLPSCDYMELLFDELFQIADVIIGNHILPDSYENKISDTIKLLDLRRQFNFYVAKDCCTAFRVVDFDEMGPPGGRPDFDPCNR